MSEILSEVSQLVDTTITQACQLTANVLDKILDGFADDMSKRLAEAMAALPTNSTSLEENLGPAVDLLNPVIEYVQKHPWILVPLVVPVLKAWLLIIGIQAAGIAAESIAATIETPIGSISDDTLFKFLATNGAAGFARAALIRDPRWRLIAALLGGVGQALLRIDDGKFAADVSTVLESTWNNTTPTINCDNGVASSVPFAAIRWLAVGAGAVCAWIQL